MKSFPQKLKCLLQEIQAWLGLLGWLAALIGTSLAFWAKYWPATDIAMSVNIRLLAVGIFGILFALIILVWMSHKKDRDIKSLIGLIPVKPKRRPDVEERILSVLWKHSGCGSEYFTLRHSALFKEDSRLIDHHLRELWEIHFVSRVSNAYSIDDAGRKYVVKYGLHTKSA